MGKSTIPIIIESPYLSDIFVEILNKEKLINTFYLKTCKLERVNDGKFKIIIVDTLSLKKILKLKKNISKIILINDLNESISCPGVEITNINVPFRMRDLFERIETIISQTDINNQRLQKYKKFTYDPSTRILSNDLSSLRFTEKESQIFVCLAEMNNSYISKKELLSKIWSYGEEIDTHTLETHVYALRKKIETNLNLKNLINFEEKHGYFIDKKIL